MVHSGSKVQFVVAMYRMRKRRGIQKLNMSRPFTIIKNVSGSPVLREWKTGCDGGDHTSEPPGTEGVGVVASNVPFSGLSVASRSTVLKSRFLRKIEICVSVSDPASTSRD